MKKVIILLLVFTLAIMTGMEGIFAEALPEEVITEPTGADVWIDAVKGFASFKNFILSAAGLSTLLTLLKMRKEYKDLKSPEGAAKLEKFALAIIGKVSDKPELVIKIVKIVVAFPVINDLIKKFQHKAGMYELELQGKIMDIEAKLSANVYEGDKFTEASGYLLKLRDEYETIRSDQ